jgi:4-aminobutyrate aminotransferase-like enzyme
MRAGLATLDVLEDERLGARARALGERLREELRGRLSRYPMVKDVRGLGLLNGIEFQAPREMRLRVPFAAFSRIHAAMFGQVLVMRLFRDRRIYSQICGNAFLVLKASPALTVSDEQVSDYLDGVEATVDLMHRSARFWSEALGMARRVLDVI